MFKEWFRTHYTAEEILAFARELQDDLKRFGDTLPREEVLYDIAEIDGLVRLAARLVDEGRS